MQRTQLRDVDSRVAPFPCNRTAASVIVGVAMSSRVSKPFLKVRPSLGRHWLESRCKLNFAQHVVISCVICRFCLWCLQVGPVWFVLRSKHLWEDCRISQVVFGNVVFRPAHQIFHFTFSLKPHIIAYRWKLLWLVHNMPEVSKVPHLFWNALRASTLTFVRWTLSFWCFSVWQFTRLSERKACPFFVGSPHAATGLVWLGTRYGPWS